MQRIETWLLPVVRRLWPGIDTASSATRDFGVMSFAILIYAVPLALAGVVWLVSRTDLQVIRDSWPILLALGLLVYLFKRFTFFTTLEVSPGMYVTANTHIEIVVWSSALLLGPTVLWLDVITEAIRTVTQWRRQDISERLNLSLNLALGLAMMILARLAALVLYSRWGGVIPLPGFTPEALAPALLATLVELGLGLAINFPWIILAMRTMAMVAQNVPSLRLLIGGMRLWFGTNFLLAPFGILLAGIQSSSGWVIYFLLTGGALVAAFVGSRLSHALEEGRQRTREMQQLEHLGRAILGSPPDGALLRDLLAEHLPGMFTLSQVEIRLFPDETLIRLNEETDQPDAAAWAWLQANSGSHVFKPGSAPPWGARLLSSHTLFTSILDVESGAPLGGVWIARRRETGSVHELLPAAQTLSAQIASALHSAEVYRATLAHQRTVQELNVAGSIQASFLPGEVPQMEGWQISATLESARETSGDFFDLIPMWDGRLVALVADVADKGLGAALFMALSRTLLRTYATEYSTRYPDSYAFHPERVLNTVNHSIVHDTPSDLFVTLFYAILDPALASVTYANAGHNPPYLFSRSETTGEIEARPLRLTGIPIGIMPDQVWGRGSVHMQPGDVLVMYTDGLVDAENDSQDHFGADRLVSTVRAVLGQSAAEVRQAVLDAVHEFMGGTAPVDDVTLLVIRREKPEL
jgi:serine phosphatase RsbU (regulator of sigma subunit)